MFSRSGGPRFKLSRRVQELSATCTISHVSDIDTAASITARVHARSPHCRDVLSGSDLTTPAERRSETSFLRRVAVGTIPEAESGEGVSEDRKETCEVRT